MTLPYRSSHETAAGLSRFDAPSLRARFDSAGPPLVGIEEELMAVHPQTLDPLPSAPALLERLADDPRFKLELPACQIEIVTPPRQTIDELLQDLVQARRRLVLAIDGDACLLAAGVHPSASGEGDLNLHGRYGKVADEYRFAAHRQMVCGLHVHVSLGGADRTLAVYNAMRSYLPWLAALATNAPIYGGRDTGLMSIRPLLAGLLPRQGVPPRLESWEQLCAELAWGAQTGRLLRVQGWWWELRIHPELATLEVRVADAQSTNAETAAVAAVAASLILRLGELHDAGELEPSAPGWRIAENRWSAIRDGVHGVMYDLMSGRPQPTRELLAGLIQQLQTTTPIIGGKLHLARAMRMLEHNGADRQRNLLRSLDDHHAVARELTHLFLARG
jgi:carboxylate-amine ligase